MNVFQRLWKIIKKEPPEVGMLCCVEGEQGKIDPWNMSRKTLIRVEEIKDGWVKYSYPNSPTSDDGCYTIRMFWGVYHPIGCNLHENLYKTLEHH